MSEPVSCSFCGKPRSDVQQIIRAEKAAICNECVALCVSILLNVAQLKEEK